MKLHSSAFSDGSEIPSRYTCDGSHLSPPLSWSELPNGTQSLALIIEDPDAPDPQAPKRTFIHWVIYNIPTQLEGLPEGAAAQGLPQGVRSGLTDAQHTSYSAPCPPIGRHRYFHRLFALDTRLPELGSPTKRALEQAMAGHILDQTELMGTYQSAH